MSTTRYAFTPPKVAMLRWLTDPGRVVAPEIGRVLLGELFASPKAVIAAVLNGLVLNLVALLMHSGAIFAVFILVDAVLAVARVMVVRRAFDAAARGLPTPTDLYVLTAGSWCALQGAMAFSAMRTSNLALQLLAASTVMAMVGPICARNYAAPRYAIMLVMLSSAPFVAGAAVSRNPWLMVLVVEFPLFLYGVVITVQRFHGMAVAMLQAEQDSYDRARHDNLTGLLNRFGLMEALDARFASYPRFTLFYLDLDGFKPINDSFGHQVGDEILRGVADRLRACLRTVDIIARLGGDEFVIVAPDMTPAEGAMLASAIIRRVAGEAYVVAGMSPLRIGISIGFACVPDDGIAGDDLHRKADAALYEAKASGKGIYRRFSTTPRRRPAPKRMPVAARY